MIFEIDKLIKFGLDQRLCSFLDNYLYNRYQYIDFNG